MARLKSFEEIRRCRGALNRRPARIAAIPLHCIVGSVSATQVTALRADFLPRRRGTQDARYQHVYRALQADVPLPAIEVYALDGAFFVVDGHHRVAAARALGRAYIDALVHEFVLPPAPMGSDQAPLPRPVPRAWWRRRRVASCSAPCAA